MSTLTILDMLGAREEARNTVDEWRAEFLREFFAPVVQAEMAKVLLSLTPEQQESVRKSHPEMFDMLNTMIRDLRGRAIG